MSFVELRAKTHYSFLRAVSSPEELIHQAISLGQSALGITDRNGVFGLPKAWGELKKLRAAVPNLNFKLLAGAELILDGFPSLFLLPKTRQGYGVMCRILTAAHEGKEKGMGSLAWRKLEKVLHDYPTSGLIALPSLPDVTVHTNDFNPDHYYGHLSEIFPRQVYLPLARLSDGFDEERSNHAFAIENRFQITLVASQEVLFLSPDQKKRHDVLTSIREGKPLLDIGRTIQSNAEKTLKSEIEIHALFKDRPDAIYRTLEIAEQCTFEMDELKYRYPNEWVPQGHTAQSFLVDLVEQGARRRYPEGISEKIRHQISEELVLIKELGHADYFLTIWDVVEYANRRGILCQGRGSAANSVVCYCLGITAIDPIQMDFLFGRFLSAERGEPPDIDVDFEHSRREEVLQYVYQKYGRDRAAMVAAVVTYRSKMSRNEVTKAYAGLSATPEKIEAMAEELVQTPRHLSIHSGGFTLSADPMVEIVPIEPARMEGRTVIQWDKYDLDILNLLKVDLLSLGMLTALKESLDLTGFKEIAAIPPDDQKTYEMIQKADTIGVFQIESRAQMSMLPRLKPACFYDLVIELAIVRPGPIVGKMVHPFLRRRDKLEPVTLPHPKLKKILGKTLGVPIFQEQIMKMAVELAGYTPGESDALRRAIGAWRAKGDLNQVAAKLKAGLLQSGLPLPFVEQIFEQIKGFAEYGFPESHSASFSLLAYASSYLKCHHPAEFTCSLLNAQPMGFYSTNTLLEDAKHHGVEVRPPDVQISQYKSTIEKDASQKSCIRLGLHQVSGLPQKTAEALAQARPFHSVEDFVARTHLKKDVLERLALAGFFDSFKSSPRATLWKLLKTYSDRGTLFEQKTETKGEITDEKSSETQQLFFAMAPEQKMRADFNAYDVSPGMHPMKILRTNLSSSWLTAREIRNLAATHSPRVKPGTRITISGWVIVRQVPPTANGMCFVTLEDETGFIDVAFKPDVHERYRSLLKKSPIIVVEGVMQRSGNAISILAISMRPIDGEESPFNIKDIDTPQARGSYHPWSLD